MLENTLSHKVELKTMNKQVISSTNNEEQENIL